MRNQFGLTTIMASFALVFAVHEPANSQEGSDQSSHQYGDAIEITPDVRMIVGRELDMAAGEVDVANVILYRTGSTLVVIDTGGTSEFIQFLDAAAEQLRPFDEVVLITSHGHADHVGNNAWIGTLGVSATHYISAHDLGLMRDQIPYFAERFDAAIPFLPDSPPGEELARQIIDMFGGLDVESDALIVLESLPLQGIRVGSTIWNGWRLLDGEVLVLRSSGHTEGHVVVFLVEPGMLHLADETTGYYQAFPGGSQQANLSTLQRALAAVEEGTVKYLTDGHTFAAHSGTDAESLLRGLIRGAVDYDAAVSRILNENPDGITIPELVDAVGSAPEMADAPGGANPIPIFATMQLLNKLDELGIPAPGGAGGKVNFPN